MAMRLLRTLSVLMLSLAPTLPVAADQRLSDLLLQLQRLQQEVQQLRGRIELQQHEISTLKRQQREQYMDLDARLQGRSPAAPTGTVAPDVTGMPPQHSKAPPETPAAEKQAYRAAFDLLKKRRYEDAIRAFEDLLARYPNGEFADNAHYWLGEASYVKRDYSASLTQFQRVLASYPLSPKVPGSMLKIGYIHYDQGDWQRARATLQDVTAKFPDSAEARLAESRLERMTREGH
jgi:tol-pal system protein YbgF